jgi:ABC-type arginine transport system ATPase subunit
LEASARDNALDINRDNARNVFRVSSEAGEEQLKELVQQLGVVFGGGVGWQHMCNLMYSSKILNN